MFELNVSDPCPFHWHAKGLMRLLLVGSIAMLHDASISASESWLIHFGEHLNDWFGPIPLKKGHT